MTNSQALEIVVDRVVELLRLRLGLRPDPTLRGRVRRAIRDEASQHGQDLTTYFDILVVGSNALQDLVNRVTVQETAFFRHPEHFEVLARDVLPTLPRPVTIWSAGCANGQEAFSVAMLLEERGIDGTVIATDLSTAALHRTTVARYTGRELSGLSPDRISRHLRRVGDTWEVNRSIRDRVRTLQHNLLEPLPPEIQSCQVVLCRNVLIYLSPEHARAFLERIADTLAATTALFLGAAETMWPVSDRFRACPVGDTFIYRQPAASAASAESRPDRRTPPTEAGRTRFERTVRTRTARIVAVAPESVEPAALLAKDGQDAIGAGDYDAAVVAFRKCAYLAPHDPVAQLHLGLALEAAGDERSAQRAYAAARRTLLKADPAHSVAGIEGYATAELVKLLDSKQRVPAP
jgi:chemotaxis methyl-accepting protein methylase